MTCLSALVVWNCENTLLEQNFADLKNLRDDDEFCSTWCNADHASGETPQVHALDSPKRHDTIRTNATGASSFEGTQ
jgi:hypothetical protein